MDDDDVVYLSLLYLYWKVNRKKQRKRLMWIHPIIEERQRKGHFHTLFAEVKRDEDKFFNFTRMSRGTFDELVTILFGKLTRKNTCMRESITPEEKLVITLRYLASGCSLVELHYNFRVGRSTASIIIKEVCEAIWTELANKTIPQCSTEKWIEIARGFQTFAQFPNCIGAIDGKHIRTKQPPNSGSMYYNYKHYFSTVLFAMCDANYCFTYIDVGSYGKSSDAGIFKRSKLYEKLCEGTLGLPAPSTIDSTNEKYPFVIVGDEAFPLSENLLRPYGGKHLTNVKETFNTRLSRARRYIECCFGILANKWRIFHRPIDLDIDVTETLVKAACVLHNFVRTRDGIRSHDENLDVETNLGSLLPDKLHRGNLLSLSARDKYAQYFVKQNRLNN